MKENPYSELLNDLYGRIVASCSCSTKTPVVEYHKDDCEYRIIMRLIDYYEKLEAHDN